MKKIISLIICLIMVVSVFGGCMLQKKDGVAITVGDTQMTTSEFAYYVYMCKAQLAQEQGVTLGDEATEKEFLDAENGDVTNRDVVIENAVKEAFDFRIANTNGQSVHTSDEPTRAGNFPCPVRNTAYMIMKVPILILSGKK